MGETLMRIRGLVANVVVVKTSVLRGKKAIRAKSRGGDFPKDDITRRDP